MATKWTAAQCAAIETKNKTLLLSAAAGSGKTSTLTERIIRSITDKDSPSDISDMLIVTFTRASATDLKTKIFTALSNALAKDPSNKHLTRQLIKLGSARISTIDSFYLDAVKKNFASLGLSSSFRIADNAETDLLAKSVMNDVVEYFYDNVEAFPALCECFEGIRDTEDVMESVLLGLYTDCLHTPEGVDYLLKCAKFALADKDKDLFETTFGDILRRYAIGMFSDYLKHFEEALFAISSDEKAYKAYYDACDHDRIFCVEMLNALEGKSDSTSYSDAATLLSEHEFLKMGALRSQFATEDSLFLKQLRGSFKDSVKKLKDEFFEYSPNDLSKFFQYTAKNLDILYSVLSEFEKRYFEEKKRRNILELTDVKRYALKLFANDDGTPTDVAKSYSEQFTDIYIDEYQDVDPVQDLIFRCLSTPRNRFMVGDIKQSIYSFRGAEPSLFAHYRAAFPSHTSEDAENSDCSTIFMSENFRCARPIIDFTNLVCSNIFSACGESIGYTKEDDLVCAKIDPEGAPLPPKVTVAFFAKQPKSKDEAPSDGSMELSCAESEAKYIAHEIQKLLACGKKQNGEPILPCDIAILFRNKRSSIYISRALKELGIKCTATESTQYFQNPDVLMTLCILNAVDNPQRDIYLAGALRSPIFGFTLDDILLINKCGCSADSLYDKLCIAADTDSEIGARCRQFNDTLTSWRSISASLPIDKFLRKLFTSEAFVASGLFCEKNSSGEGGNLQRLYEYARTFEAGSFKGLYNFIEFINNIIENGTTLESGGNDISPDCVTLTTIHKSKGLEFPVCFVCNSASDMNRNLSSDLSFEYGVGIAMDLSDETGFAHYLSPLKKILELNYRQRSVEEEMRVLYVALTRAKEKLYVTGSYSRRTMPNILEAASFDSRFNCRYSVMSASCYLDWILSSTKADDKNGCAEILPFDTAYSAPLIEEIQEYEETVSEEKNAEFFETLKEKFAFEYPYKLLKRVPAKLSVSRLSPDVLDENDSSVDIFEQNRPTPVPDFFLPSLQKSSATERGTATHLFLQFCDFEFAAKHGIAQTVDMLTEKRFITREIADLIYKEDLEKLMKSELASQVLSAKRIIREQRFNILLPTASFTQDDKLRERIADEKIAIQGVIDLIVIDSDGRLCLYDYKTDRLSKAELANDALATEKMNKLHGSQLSYYAKAVSVLFGKAPDRVAVYSTCAAKLFDIEMCELTIPHDIL
ncbi:MAG: UvrD-helicase domain-containing protein [Clostridia bacterium]|nr:UvrD-helicase domain-containing protein [Clostridia bacterium]